MLQLRNRYQQVPELRLQKYYRSQFYPISQHFTSKWSRCHLCTWLFQLRHLLSWLWPCLAIDLASSALRSLAHPHVLSSGLDHAFSHSTIPLSKCSLQSQCRILCLGACHPTSRHRNIGHLATCTAPCPDARRALFARSEGRRRRRGRLGTRHRPPAKDIDSATDLASEKY